MSDSAQRLKNRGLAAHRIRKYLQEMVGAMTLPEVERACGAIIEAASQVLAEEREARGRFPGGGPAPMGDHHE